MKRLRCLVGANAGLVYTVPDSVAEKLLRTHRAELVTDDERDGVERADLPHPTTRSASECG